MFEHVVQEALKQLDNQVAQLSKAGKKPISVLVLAGGGGTSRYVICRFQEHSQSRLDGNISVRRDIQAWSAVSRGGAIRGLENGTIVSREAKRAYGFACHQKFNAFIDKEEDSWECPSLGKRAPDHMGWILKRVIWPLLLTR